MNKKLLYFLLIFCYCIPFNANAIGIDTSVWDAWGYNDNTQWAASALGNFILAGSIGKGGPHGTFGDEWGVVAIVARKITQHGGYFCPTQIQCANKRKEKKGWTVYYNPSGFSNEKCI